MFTEITDQTNFFQKVANELLLTCPFCEVQPSITARESSLTIEGTRSYSMLCYCPCCKIRLERIHGSSKTLPRNSIYKVLLSKLAAQWNKRP